MKSCRLILVHVLPNRWPIGFLLSVFLLTMPAHAQPALSLEEGFVGTTVFQGQELTYTVRDGLAIHGGDIVLGTAEEAAVAAQGNGVSQEPAVAEQDAGSLQPGLWPGGVIPYVIDDDVTNSEGVLKAIEEWNTKTVISLVERSTEEDYVRFRSSPTVSCRADQGRVGARTVRYVARQLCLQRRGSRDRSHHRHVA